MYNIDFEQNEKSELLKICLNVSSKKAYSKYRQVFHLYEEKEKIAWFWNWPAFLLGGYYLIYRKSYLLGILTEI